MHDPQYNPKDPLLTSGPAAQRELFDRYRESSRDFPIEHVVGAAINMLINALRQSRPTKSLAEQGFDEVMGQAKQLLVSHYDSATGKRLNIFPFTQVIEASLYLDPDSSRGKKFNGRT